MKVTHTSERETLTALAAGARSLDPARAKAARFALNARRLAEENRTPATHATTIYGAKK
jgi:hypothetical protein